jgi:hypothetical protein
MSATLTESKEEAMGRKITWALLFLALVVGLGGCRSAGVTTEETGTTRAVTQPGEYPWPGISCPPGHPYFTARDRLTRTAFLARLDNEEEIAELADVCRDSHYIREDHQVIPEVFSVRVWDAYLYARRASKIDLDLEPWREAEKKQLWLNCKGELEH